MYEDTFEFVSLWLNNLEQSADMAKTFFGSTESRIVKIEYLENGEPFVIITDFLRIIFPEAIKRNEITVLNFDN
ncbi:MAG: hypothetical protein RLZZ175_1673, partial [Bacteroidota bacterium]